MVPVFEIKKEIPGNNVAVSQRSRTAFDESLAGGWSFARMGLLPLSQRTIICAGNSRFSTRLTGGKYQEALAGLERVTREPLRSHWQQRVHC
jgi:hypothetical protein